MIFAWVEPEVYLNHPIRFRGKTLEFWYPELFPSLEFLPPINLPDQFSWLILFSSHVFYAADSHHLAQLTTLLSHRPAEPGIVYAPEGTPFLAIPFEEFKRLNLKKKERIWDIVFEGSKLEPLPSFQPCPVWDLVLEARRVEQFIIAHQVRQLLSSEVMIEDFGQFYLEGDIPVGRGSRISTGAVIRGRSSIGANVEIGAHAVVESSTIGDSSQVLPGCVIRDSVLEEGVQVGPYTHLRNGSVVQKGAKMGNFVEMKKSTLGPGSKAMHLTYIGDSEVGKNVNVGAGTITCNYDGVKKNKTLIGDRVFIGSGTQLVAPVKIEDDGYIGAGSTITEDVPAGALAVTRVKQRNLPGWVVRKRKVKR